MKAKADNKTTTLFEKGLTEDIIFSVLSVFADSYEQVEDLAQQLKGRTIKETAKNVSDFVLKNFRYKVDPDGQQWIKTPARLVQDCEADCKSFSLFVCSVFSCLGIENGFRFVSYSKDPEPTHVYTFAYDEDGKEFIIDTVAQIQKALPPFKEIKYKHKKDYMNTTKISKLSGVDENTRSFLPTDSQAEVYAKCLFFYSTILKQTRQATAYKVLLDCLEKYSNSQRDLELALYKWADLYINVSEVSEENQIKIISDFVKNVGVANEQYTLNAEVLENQVFKNVMDWLDTYIYPYVNVYFENDTTQIVDAIYINSFNFLYLFIPDTYLTKIQKAKKANQRILLEKLISNTNINYNSALLLIRCFYFMIFKNTPRNVAAYMFKSIPAEQAPQIGFVDEDQFQRIDVNDPLGGGLNTSTTTTKTKSKADQVGDWVKLGTDALEKIFSLFGIGNNNKQNYVYNGITPTPTDTSNSMFNYVLVIGLAVGGFLFIKKNNKKKGKK